MASCRSGEWYPLKTALHLIINAPSQAACHLVGSTQLGSPHLFLPMSLVWRRTSQLSHCNADGAMSSNTETLFSVVRLKKVWSVLVQQARIKYCIWGMKKREKKSHFNQNIKRTTFDIFLLFSKYVDFNLWSWSEGKTNVQTSRLPAGSMFWISLGSTGRAFW